MKSFTIVALGLAFAPTGATAQMPTDDVVDRLVAVVGDSIVLRSQIQEELQRMAMGGADVPPPTDPAYEDAFRTLLDQFVNRLLVLQAAARDSLINVDEATIEERVAERISQLALQVGGQPALQQALAAEGLTLAEYREFLKSDARASQIQQLYLQSRLRDAEPETVTEDEMMARFQEVRGTLEQRPRLLTFRQVAIRPEASEAAKEAARVKADSLFALVAAGGDFAELAREHSADAGSAQLGGDLGWFRRGRMVREFEDAAFSVLQGIPPIVESDFGYHIIEVQRSRAGERQARHILIMPERTEADVERARQLATEIMTRARNGESMAALSDEFGDGETPDSLTLPFDQLSEFPPAYGVLRNAPEGTVIGPIDFELGGNESRVAVAKILAVREAGAYTFDDLRGQIAAALQDEKKQARLVDELRANTYIEIRM